MKPIEGKVFAPFQKSIPDPIYNEKTTVLPHLSIREKTVWERIEPTTVNSIRACDGFPVKTFRELMDIVAQVTLNNGSYEMYYRGQVLDYKNNQSSFYRNRTPKTVILPTICRPGEKSNKRSITKSQIIKRYDKLETMTGLAKETDLFENEKKVSFNEYYYSLFQHYDIISTPLIDITQSLRVAASFALRESNTGYVYVFGLPFPNQSISCFADLGIVLIKLQNVVPVDAIRPRYQEGFLVGKFPITATKSNFDNLANRLIAKFQVDNTKGNFWDDFFQPMPEDLLFPKKDKVESELNRIKERYDNLS